MKWISYLGTRIRKEINRFVRVLVYCFPRNKNLIVYGGAKDLFIDNTKYLFIYNNQNLKTRRHVWLSGKQSVQKRVKELGFECVNSKSLYGKFLVLRAGTIVFDDSMRHFASLNMGSGATRLELWHGLPLKMWAHAKAEDQPAYVKQSFFKENFSLAHTHGTHCISTARNLDKIFSASFCVPYENIIHATYPRTLILQQNEERRYNFVRKYESNSFVLEYERIKSIPLKKIIYMPTFRDAKPEYINEAIPDWNSMNLFCKENGIVLFLKLHRETPLPDDFDLSNIETLNNEMDVYPLLPLFDALVTDYSSIMFDFALTKKPVILYTYDMEEYVQNSRNIYKSFFTLKENLSNAEDITQLKSLMNDLSQIKRFPTEKYFDDSLDLSAITSFLST